MKPDISLSNRCLGPVNGSVPALMPHAAFRCSRSFPKISIAFSDSFHKELMAISHQLDTFMG